MLKVLAALLILATPFAFATQTPSDCISLKIATADTLLRTCASDIQLSSDEASSFMQISQTLQNQCGDARAAEVLDRAVLYKKLELTENCMQKAELLGKSL